MQPSKTLTQSEYLALVNSWLRKGRALAPEVCDWIGVYFFASYLNHEASTDLVLGAFIGDVTEHTRIPLDKGLCGLALREKQIVNVDDVTQDTRHIACSLKTRSELVVPLKNRAGDYIAELDIDSNQYAAFSVELVKLFTDFAQTFPEWD